MKMSLTAIILVALITPVPTVAVFEDDDEVEEVVVTADRESVWSRVGRLYADQMWDEYHMAEAQRQEEREAAQALADAAAKACEQAQQDAAAAGALIAITAGGSCRVAISPILPPNSLALRRSVWRQQRVRATSHQQTRKRS